MKVDRAVVKETEYLAVACICFGILVQIIFFLTGKYDYTVLLGSIYGVGLIIFDFLFRGITIQKSLGKSPLEAEKSIRNSYRIRMVVLVAFVVFAVLSPVFNTWSLILSLLFPKIYYMFIPVFRKDLK